MCRLGRKLWTKIEIVVYLVVCYVANGNAQSCTTMSRASFPPSFLFGVGSSAYQYEGATAEGGRKPCIWDTYIQKHPDQVVDKSNANIANDQYHRYKEDVALMKDIGVDVYRFSISWSRVLPNGNLRGGVNQEGINYYNNLINELVSKGMKAIVTLFHWDLPQALEDEYQGFLSPKIIDDFRDYADLCFRMFGDRVKIWATLNEPMMYAMVGYARGIFPPGRCSNRTSCPAGDSATEPYIVAHNLILAHAAAVKVYREKYQATQKGQIGMSLNCIGMVPYSPSTKDQIAANRALAFYFGWFMTPMYNGSYPVEMITNVGKRLPQFTKVQSDMVKGSYDFVGVNYYTSRFAADVPCPTQNFTYSTDACISMKTERDGIPIGPSQEGSWVNVYPDGLLQHLLYIKDNYNSPLMYITENGVGDPKENTPTIFLEDSQRIEYIEGHLTRVIEAIRLGARVEAYTIWSFLDNFEWFGGYTSRAGIVHVDRNNGLKRIPKHSAMWLKNLLSSNNQMCPSKS